MFNDESSNFFPTEKDLAQLYSLTRVQLRVVDIMN